MTTIHHHFLSCREALNTVAQVVPDWLGALAPEVWYQRYERRPEGFRLTEKERLALIEQIGADGHQLLEAVYRAYNMGLHQLPAVESLRRIWIQQFYIEDGMVHFRQNKDYRPSREMIYSPYDLDARLGAKRETEWQGYKVHLTAQVLSSGKTGWKSARIRVE